MLDAALLDEGEAIARTVIRLSEDYGDRDRAAAREVLLDDFSFAFFTRLTDARNADELATRLVSDVRQHIENCVIVIEGRRAEEP